MGAQNRIIPVVVLFLAAIVLQLALIAADCRQTPLRVAAQFTKDYFYLDADMQKYLCESLAADGELVDDYLQLKYQEASQRGLSTKYLRHKFTKLHFSTESHGEDTLHVHVQGNTRVAINPVFMLVGKFFFIGKDYPVDATLELVKEKTGWKVCGTPFGLSN
jgi:hypothetical protein